MPRKSEIRTLIDRALESNQNLMLTDHSNRIALSDFILQTVWMAVSGGEPVDPTRILSAQDVIDTYKYSSAVGMPKAMDSMYRDIRRRLEELGNSNAFIDDL